jgi:hypothetical protein
MLLEKAQADISYGLDGQVDEVSMTVASLITYTDLVVFLTLDNLNVFQEEYKNDPENTSNP